MQTMGRIAGGWGLVALLSSPLAWKLASDTYAIAEAALGVALVLVYVASRRGAQSEKTQREGNQRPTFFWATSAMIAAATAVLLVGVNFIAAKRAKTVDMTNKKIHSLAPQSLQTLKDLKEPVKALGFMGPDHPGYDTLKNHFERFAAESDKFTYDFKDPKKSIELNAKYQIKEGQSTVILVKGSGASEQHTALSVISEQELTNALLKLNSTGTQKIYFLAGHGEWSLAPAQAEAPELSPTPSVSELKQSLEQEGYAVDTLDLGTAQNAIPKDAAMLVIAHASEPFPQAQVNALDQFIQQGGRLLYFADWDAESGLEPMLTKYGIQIEKGVVADALNPNSPYQAIGFATDHEVGNVLKQLNANMLFDTSRGLTVVKQGTAPGVVTTPVMLSSPKSWIETTPENPDPSENERLGAIPVIMASTVDTKTAPDKRFDEGRVLVFGDAGLIVNANWGHEVIRNLVLNAFGWTSTQIAKITIRPPDRDLSTLTISDDMMRRIGFLSMIGLPQLMIALGIAIRVTRRSK